MSITIPDYFYKNPDPGPIKVNDFSFVKYLLTKNHCHLQCQLESHVLVVVLGGKKKVTIEDETVEGHPGNLIFVKKGKYVMSHVIETAARGYESLLFSFDDVFFKGLLEESVHLINSPGITGECKSACVVPMNSFLEASIQSLFPFFYYKNEYSGELLGLKFKEIFLNLLSSERGGYFKNFLKSISSTDTDDLRYFMEKNFCENIPVYDFARKTGRSLTKFKSDFKKIFDVSPKEWITRRRLERAKLLAGNTGESVTNISYLVGINNISTFIKLFKREYGLTPKQFQKMSGNGKNASESNS